MNSYYCRNPCCKCANEFHLPAAIFYQRDTVLGVHFPLHTSWALGSVTQGHAQVQDSRHNTTALVRRLAFWPGKTCDAAAYVRYCNKDQRTRAEHVGPRCLLYPMRHPTRQGGAIGVDWLMGLPLTVQIFDQVQVLVNYLARFMWFPPGLPTPPTTRSTWPYGPAARSVYLTSWWWITTQN